MIASEDIEVNQHARSVHNTVNLLLQLAGTAPNGMGGSEKASETLDELRKLAGKDVNSLQLVSSAGRDALVVRFGASYGVQTRYALYPQTRRIHCLIMIPNSYVPCLDPSSASGAGQGQCPLGQNDASSAASHGDLYALANTSFRYMDARTPKLDRMAYWVWIDRDSAEITVRSTGSKLGKNLERLKADTGLQLTGEDLQKLWGYYNAGEYNLFASYLSDKGLPYAVPVLWAEMARIGLRSSWSYTLIPLPARQHQIKENYLAIDDGTTITVKLPAAGYSAEAGCWDLAIDRPEVLQRVLPAGENVRLLPTKAYVDKEDDSALYLEFPSFRRMLRRPPPYFEEKLYYQKKCVSNSNAAEKFTIYVGYMPKPAVNSAQVKKTAARRKRPARSTRPGTVQAPAPSAAAPAHPPSVPPRVPGS